MGGVTMSSFSIDMDDPKEAWEALFRELEASAEPEAAEGSLETAEGVPVMVRSVGAVEDLVGWLWLMQACWTDDAS
jgi:hypothetical protein